MKILTASVSDCVTTIEVKSSDSHKSDPSKKADHSPHQLDDITKSESTCNCSIQTISAKPTRKSLI